MRRQGEARRLHILVTGGAGFIGSHLCQFFINRGHTVIAMDNLITGEVANIECLLGHPRFRFIQQDVTNYIHVVGPLDAVMHFASPAAPKDYLQYPIPTLKVGALGTHKALGLAKEKGAIFLLASTSEVYGDPLVNPQPERYWGNVNPVGPRGVYDEAKRFAEAMATAYHRYHRLPVRIARIFNTYGPAMRIDDGRAIPQFVCQALQGKSLTIYGDGSQTRSFCYITDTVEGIYRLLLSNVSQPVNIGNPQEFAIRELAQQIVQITHSQSRVVYKPLPKDDPHVRCPDIHLAKRYLHWRPRVSLRVGLLKTIRDFRARLS